MRIFAISDLHVDYDSNKEWVFNISNEEYKNDILILPGDITDNILEISKIFRKLKNSFKEVLFVPGNHDLWTVRYSNINSFEKFKVLRNVADNSGIVMQPYIYKTLTIIPLYGWYDFSFAKPTENTIRNWVDFVACKWPENYDLKYITKKFIQLNNTNMNLKNTNIITFSHFLPRIDIMPFYLPQSSKEIYPMLGCDLLGKQTDYIAPDIHIYGHSHLNIDITKGKTQYINNAFGYPHEIRICKKAIKQIFEVN